MTTLTDIQTEEQLSATYMAVSAFLSSDPMSSLSPGNMLTPMLALM